jgi:hypothetical protein
MKFFILLAPVVVLILGFPAYGAVKWPAEQLLPSFSKPASPQDLISIPPEGTDQPAADAVLFSSLKGLINRTKPRIWTAEGTGTDKFKWLADLGLSYTEISDPWTLFTKYHREIKGLVVYDDAQPDTINLASTIAGQRNALVVAPQSVAMLTAAPYNFPILVDLRGKFADKLSVYQYLYDNYWTGATHRVLVGLNPTTLPGALREYAIAVNSAVVWLDPRKPDQKALLDRFLSTMAPGTLFMGWWPEEGTGVTAASSYGVVTCASDWCTNLSNFSGTSRKVAVKGTPKDMPQIENKIYLAFIMSDGDNLQYQEHHLRDIWNDPARGTVPMGWTMSPMMLDAMPGVLNYYYKTATPNDCLLCGPSGYGYTYPNYWTDQTALAQFIAKTDEYCRRSGFRIITVWNTIKGGIDPSVGAAYADNAPSLLGVTAEDAGNGLTIYDKKLPGFSLSATYCGNMVQLTREIRGSSVGWEGKSPRFLIIQAQPWGGLMPKDFVKLVDGLDPNYVIVRPDTIFKMMRSVNGLPTDPLNPN